MLQVAFDIFDSNNDDKVSELDIFKVFYQFSQSSQTDEFQHVFYNDICQMSKQLNKNWSKKYKQVLLDNSNDKLYVERMRHWRNLQKIDINFGKKKQKVVWPLFDFNQRQGMMIKNSESQEPAPRRKLGFNKKLYNNISSVRNVEALEPVLSLNEKAHRKIESESDKDSEDEWKNADYFLKVPYFGNMSRRCEKAPSP